MCVGFDPMSTVPSLPYEPDDMMVQKPVALSPTESYRSGSPRSWPNSCENTPTPPFSGSIV